jgi:inositol transport system substrate-binding protein
MLRNSARRRRLAALVTMIAAVAALAGCGAASNDDSKAVGLSVLNMRDPDLANMTKVMTAHAKTQGVNVQAVDAKGDVSTELNQVEDLVTKKPKAIIMEPIDGKASQTAAKQANNADIPLFILSTEFTAPISAKYVSYIGVDDTEAGRIQGDYVNKMLPQGGKIIYLVGTYGASWTDRRKAGFMAVKNPNIKIASELQANGSRDDAKRITEDLLRKYGKGQIVGLVAHNDEMAIGAAQAIKEAGRQGDFKVIVGVDGTQPGLEAIKSGEMTATVLQRSADQGKKAVDVVNQYLAGKKVDKSYHLPFKLVTKDNLAQFLGN